MKMAEEGKATRGEFISALDLKQALYDSEELKEGDITLSAKQIRRIWNHVICPCGQCQYYAVEFFSDGRYVVHHHTKGVMSEGNYL